MTDDDDGFSFELPPIRLPPLFPADVRVLWPGGGDRPRSRVGVRTVALACLAFDVLDALLALTVDAALVTAARTVGGALLAGVLFGPFGVAYVWEPTAALLGVGELTVVPTLSLLLLARVLREVVGVRRRHPEEVDGPPEEERERPRDDDERARVLERAGAEAQRAQDQRRPDVDDRNEDGGVGDGAPARGQRDAEEPRAERGDGGVQEHDDGDPCGGDGRDHTLVFVLGPFFAIGK